MVAIYEDGDGLRHYYVPTKTPEPSPSNVDTPQFQRALDTAGAATTAYQKNPTKANRAALNEDWNVVQGMITEQYRLALSSSDPAKQVAALNEHYGQIFQGNKGAAASIYHTYVLPSARKEAAGEPRGVRDTEIQLYNGLNEPGNSPNKAYDVVRADINVHLEV
ncbi:MAG TPA: hypothetical protein VI653_15210, partial [Steroidobacteraceae bacterium]